MWGAIYVQSVQSLYRDFREGRLLVNRRYQRKLVWSTEEKQRLIDSILNGYPIPLILLAENSDSSYAGSYEIIDGIQRLNAILTFIENAFDYDNKYFDIKTSIKQVLISGVDMALICHKGPDIQGAYAEILYHVTHSDEIKELTMLSAERIMAAKKAFGLVQ